MMASLRFFFFFFFSYLRRLEWIICGKVDSQEKDPSLIWTISLSKEKKGGGGGHVILAEISAQTQKISNNQISTKEENTYRSHYCCLPVKHCEAH